MSSTVPTISGVIPLYNKANCIVRAVTSALGQDPPLVELIVVDDGSTDGSADRLSGIDDPRLKIVRQPNGGESSARNRGIAEACGTLVAFLDADDRWEAGFTAEILRLHAGHPEAIVFAARLAVAGVTGSRSDSSIARFKRGERLDFCAALAKWQFPLSSSSLAVRREAFAKAGLFDTELVLGPDTDMWIRLAALGVVVHSDRVGATYFLDAENRSTERADFWDRRVQSATATAAKLPSLGLSSRDRRHLHDFLSQMIYEAEGQGKLSPAGLAMVQAHRHLLTPEHRVKRRLRQWRNRLRLFLAARAAISNQPA